jgi:hypothetical protein
VQLAAAAGTAAAAGAGVADELTAGAAGVPIGAAGALAAGLVAAGAVPAGPAVCACTPTVRKMPNERMIEFRFIGNVLLNNLMTRPDA